MSGNTIKDINERVAEAKKVVAAKKETEDLNRGDNISLAEDKILAGDNFSNSEKTELRTVSNNILADNRLDQNTKNIFSKSSQNLIEGEDDEILRAFRNFIALSNSIIEADSNYQQWKKQYPERSDEENLYNFKKSSDFADNLSKDSQALLSSIYSDSYANIMGTTQDPNIKKFSFQNKFDNLEWNTEVGPDNTQQYSQTISNAKGEVCCELVGYSANNKFTANINGQEQTVNKYRLIDIAPSIEKNSGPLHMALTALDVNGESMRASEAVYLTAYYNKEGKLVEISHPEPVHFFNDDPKSPAYIVKDNQMFTLPVTREKLEELEREVLMNKGIGQSKDISSFRANAPAQTPEAGVGVGTQTAQPNNPASGPTGTAKVTPQRPTVPPPPPPPSSQSITQTDKQNVSVQAEQVGGSKASTTAGTTPLSPPPLPPVYGPYVAQTQAAASQDIGTQTNQKRILQDASSQMQDGLVNLDDHGKKGWVAKMVDWFENKFGSNRQLDETAKQDYPGELALNQDQTQNILTKEELWLKLKDSINRSNAEADLEKEGFFKEHRDQVKNNPDVKKYLVDKVKELSQDDNAKNFHQVRALQIAQIELENIDMSKDSKTVAVNEARKIQENLESNPVIEVNQKKLLNVPPQTAKSNVRTPSR